MTNPDFDPLRDREARRLPVPSSSGLLVRMRLPERPSHADKMRCPERNRHRAEARGRDVMFELRFQTRILLKPDSPYIDNPYTKARDAAHFARLHLGQSIPPEPKCHLCFDTGSVPPISMDRLEDALIIGKARPCECATGRVAAAWELPVCSTCDRCWGIGGITQDGKPRDCPDCGGRGRVSIEGCPSRSGVVLTTSGP